LQTSTNVEAPRRLLLESGDLGVTLAAVSPPRHFFEHVSSCPACGSDFEAFEPGAETERPTVTCVQGHTWTVFHAAAGGMAPEYRLGSEPQDDPDDGSPS
jgi:hypothetical protein